MLSARAVVAAITQDERKELSLEVTSPSFYQIDRRVSYVAQNGEHLKSFARGRLGPSGVRHKVANAQERAAD